MLFSHETPIRPSRKLRIQRRQRLRARLDQLLQRGKKRDALEVLMALARLEPDEPRWLRRYGDVLRASGWSVAAARAYAAAGERYARLGFAPRAAAMHALAEHMRLGVEPCMTDPARHGGGAG